MVSAGFTGVTARRFAELSSLQFWGDTSGGMNFVINTTQWLFAAPSIAVLSSPLPFLLISVVYRLLDRRSPFTFFHLATVALSLPALSFLFRKIFGL